MGSSGKQVWLHGKTFKNPADQAKYLIKAITWLKEKAKEGPKWKTLPVDPYTFVCGEYYLNMGEEVFPKVMVEIEKLLSGVYDEAVLTGGIGTGKTTIALIAIAYTLYELSCMHRPHREFDLASSSEIIFIFQSLRKELSKTVDYNRFKAMVDNSPYFQHEFRYDRGITSELRFPHLIIIKPLSGDASSAIGQNVFGGVIDEVNFMAVIENSKQAGEDGGTYDQARAIYNSIARRRESRFMDQGKLPGLLCLVSSKRYPGEFTDRKIAEAKNNHRIFVYDKRSWEVKQIEKFSGNWFDLFLGDENRKPRILKDGEKDHLSDHDKKLVIPIPLEYMKSFEDDILAAIRDIAGHSTLAQHPFIMNTDALSDCFGKCVSVLSNDYCDFEDHKVLFYPLRVANGAAPRWCHIDPSISGDGTGVAVGHVAGFTQVVRGQEVEILPKIVFDFVLEVRPPRGGEIELSNVRKLIYTLKENGLPIKWVTLDSFQSKDTLQIMMRHGFKTGYQSMDTDITPYEISKLAFYDKRVAVQAHDRAKKEWSQLERDTVKNKVDHPPKGSKDLSDAMAGVIYGLTMRREIWTAHGISTVQIPKSLIAAKKPEHKGSVSYMEKVKQKAYEDA